MIKEKIAKGTILPLFICLFSILVSNITAEVNYDTAWTFVYDGEKDSSGSTIDDKFFDVKVLENGSSICVGQSNGTSFLVKLDSNGKSILKKTYNTNSTIRSYYNIQTLHSVFIARNGDIIAGGERWGSPWIMRLDSIGNIKWSTWYYDSIKDNSILSHNAMVNSIRETSKGSIICAAGDEFPNNGGYALSNYAAYLEFDSLGNMTNWGEWSNETGYKMGGFSIEESSENRYIIAGNQTVLSIDTAGTTKWKNKYTFSLDGVGTMVNNITRAKKLRDGTLMVTGQAYEGGCWTTYKKLYFDAWWSPITSGGSHITWNTAGRQGGDDGLFDFTQLNDGKLAFVGTKATLIDSAIWVFITDSTGKQLLWEKQYNLPGVDAGGNELTTVLPLSVCATPDGGFTVVGDNNTYENNHNACAFHFIPKAVSVISKPIVAQSRMQTLHCNVTGTKLVFSLPQISKSPVNVTIYNAAGKLIANKEYRGILNGKIVWDANLMGKGVCFYKVKFDGNVFAGNVVVGR